MNAEGGIDILLSVYNGAEFLEEQLASIETQDIGAWRLIVRDDGSSDNSESIIRSFASRYPDKVVVLTAPSGRLGIVASYSCLLSNSSSPYIAFCDQDDIWMPGKLRLLYAEITSMESRYGESTPILVHSDLQVVNERLEIIDESFWHYQNLNPGKMQILAKLLVQNCVTGCATLVNRALVNMSLPIPVGAIMHDWWLALMAASNGMIREIHDSPIQYRQHWHNDTGAKRWSFEFILSSILHGKGKHIDGLKKTREQARSLLRSGKLDDEQSRLVEHYVNLSNNSWLQRRLEILRYGFFKYGIIRNLALFLWV